MREEALVSEVKYNILLEPAPQGMGAPQAKENTPGYIVDLPRKPQGSTPDALLDLLQGVCPAVHYHR